MNGESIAVIADVHGNRWALEAVLDDLDRRGLRQVVNLGDSLFGPLDPAGTARIFREMDPLSIRGNQDRAILEPGAEEGWSPTLRRVREALDADDLTWLEGHRPGFVRLEGGVVLCHGTPKRDDEYFAERVGVGGAEVKTPDELDAALGGVSADLILFGHSHVPRLLRTAGGALAVNPGAVGLPAYSDDHPFPHRMEAGSPHARYAILSAESGEWRVEHVALSYPWDEAAAEARRQERPDWAEWLRTGRAG